MDPDLRNRLNSEGGKLEIDLGVKVPGTPLVPRTVCSCPGSIVTVDETRIHHYAPETEEQSERWVTEGESPPKKTETVPSAGKIVATVFRNSEGTIPNDRLEKGKTITGAQKMK